ncbi:hypothetical protein [Streptomyces sp. NPDC058694]
MDTPAHAESRTTTRPDVVGTIGSVLSRPAANIVTLDQHAACCPS